MASLFDPPALPGLWGDAEDYDTRMILERMRRNQAYENSLFGRIADWLGRQQERLEGASAFNPIAMALEGAQIANRWAGSPAFPERVQQGDMLAPLGLGVMAAPFAVRGAIGSAGGKLKGARPEPGASAAEPQGIRAYHGSPYDFDRFDMSKIGTGEGAQAFGHGLYFADRKGTAEWYRDTLSKRHGNRSGLTINGKSRPQEYPKWAWDSLNIIKRTEDFIRENGEEGVIGFLRGEQEKMQALLDAGKAWMPDAVRKDIKNIDRLIKAFETGRAKYNRAGRLYEVNIRANPDEFLDWDKPISQQPEAVEAAAWRHLESVLDQPGPIMHDVFERFERGEATGKDIVELFVDKKRATEVLREAGIPGIKYLDRISRAAGEGSRNYVLFRDDIIDIIRKYGIAAAISTYGLEAVQGVLADMDQRQAMAGGDQ